MKPNITALIPIARLGRWYHPVYRNKKGEPVVEFTQEDFDSIKQAFLSNDRGYPPYLRYGHLKRGSGIADGEEALGWMIGIKQVDDVLVGEFELNDKQVENEILTNKYRFSSGEFVHNLPSKVTGSTIRVFLKGVALTNSPFVPGLPKNVIKVTSDDLAEYTLLSDVIQEIPMNLSDEQVAAVDKVLLALGESPSVSRELLSSLVLHQTELSLSEQAAIAIKIQSMSTNGDLTMSQLDELASLTATDEESKIKAFSDIIRISKEIHNHLTEEPSVIESTSAPIEIPAVETQPAESKPVEELPIEESLSCPETNADPMLASTSSQGFLQAFSEKFEKMFNNFLDRMKPQQNQETTNTTQEQLADESAPPLDPSVTEQESDEDMGMDEKALSELQAKLQAAEELLKKQEQELSDKQTVLAALEAEKQAKASEEHDKMLSELANGLTSKGLAPAVASKVKDFMVAAGSTSVNLSEHAGHAEFAQSLVSLLSEVLDPANHIELVQAGTSVSEANLSDDNPWVAFGFMDKK